VIERPVEEVFDYVAAERHEPNFNTRMSRVELLTAGPIGPGSLFRARADDDAAGVQPDGRVHRL
jgi:hypothetical protein